MAENDAANLPMRDHVAAMMGALREYVNAQIDAMRREVGQRFTASDDATKAALAAADKNTSAALDAAQRAVSKAESAVDKRLEGMNEFRGAVQDITATMMPRAEAENRIATLAKELGALAARIDRGEGRGSGLNASAVYIAMGVAILGGLLGIIAAIAKFIG